MAASRNEFSHAVTVAPWPEGGIAVDLAAGPAERAALAARFGLLEITALAGRGRLERAPDGREIRFRGRLEAEVVQSCVVSLEPVATAVAEAVERRFWLGPDPVPEPDVDDADADAVELEPLAGDTIDLGEVIAEELLLALPPYPRADDAYALLPPLDADVTFGTDAEPARQPFAALRALYEERTR